MAAAARELEERGLRALCESELSFRTTEYINCFLDKLASEGIMRPNDLWAASSEALKQKLETHADFNFIEMTDALALRNAFPGGQTVPMPSPRGPNDRSARSLDHDGRADRERGRDDHGAGRRRRSRSPGRGSERRGRQRGNHRRSPMREPKPDLWAAVERGDEALVQRLLEAGKSPKERFEGWTPLMKAAEENKDAIMRLLLERNSDIEAVNRKGRSALSFAAAPSMKRPTATAALKLLLERGANVSQRDNNGMTAKDRARKENRDEAVAMIEEAERARMAAPMGG